MALASVLLTAVAQLPAQAAGSGWGTPTQLAATGVLAHAAMAGDAAVLAWTDGPAVVAAYRASGGAWETAVVGAGTRPRVALNADGVAVVVWQGSVETTVDVAMRAPSSPWSAPTTIAAGRVPTPAVNEEGVIRVLALRRTANVRLYTFRGTWSVGQTLNDRPLEDTRALRRSLTLTTDAEGRTVAGWLCPAIELFPPGDRRADGWVCLRHPGSANELVEPARSGRYAVSAPGRHPIHLVTADALCEIWPGMVSSEYWWSRNHPVAQVTLEVSRGGGVASWQLAGPDGQLRVGLRRSGRWRSIAIVAHHTHGLAGATFAEPDTALAFWRSPVGDLVTAHRRSGGWQRASDRLGQSVEHAQLVSNDDGDALLAWSQTGSGVYVSERPQ